MTKPILAFVAVVLWAVPALPAPRLKPGPDDTPCFPTAVGTRWVYTGTGGEYEEAITEAEADGAATVITVVRTQEGKEIWRTTYRVSADRLEKLASGGVTYDKPLLKFWPGAKAGEAWEYTYVRDGNSFRHGHKMVGPEAVESPVGKVTAFRVEETQWTRGVGAAGPNPPTAGTEWYAAGVGLVKKEHAGRETTLKKFTPGK
jgi:hypothetical protein